MIEIVARSVAMREVLRLAERVAVTDANVLVTGESGAGKDALALLQRAEQPNLHRRRNLSDFVQQNCSTFG